MCRIQFATAEIRRGKRR